MSFQVSAVRPDLVDNAWKKLGPYISSALEHSQGEVTEEQLKKKVIAKKAQLWAVANGSSDFVGAAVTEVIAYPNMKALRITTLGGEKMSQWMWDLDKVMLRFAKFVKARHIESVGRHGFVRRLKPLGYKPTYTVLIKEIK